MHLGSQFSHPRALFSVQLVGLLGGLLGVPGGGRLGVPGGEPQPPPETKNVNISLYVEQNDVPGGRKC